MRLCSLLLNAAMLSLLALILPSAAEVGPKPPSAGNLQLPSATTAPSSTAEARPSLNLSPDVAKSVGHQIWINETGDNPEDIVAWNKGEEFMSLGIGHFLWFPAGKPAPFDESFPRVVEFYRQQKVQIPAWLDTAPIPACPWPTRSEFLKAKGTPRLVELRKFLLETKGVQTQFLLVRLQNALDAMLAGTPEDTKRKHIEYQFWRMAKASNDLYPLVDYINFKGEGTNPKETSYDPKSKANEGWGLRQVLLAMNGTSSKPSVVLTEFAEAAEFVLLRRIRNNPESKQWQQGWLRRVATYRKPLVTR